MKYFVTEIVKDIRKALELNNESQALIEVDDIDTLSLNDIGESKVLDAVRFITENAPLHLVGSGTILDGGIFWIDGVEAIGAGRMILPDDFLRLINFQMSSWIKPAKLITEDDPEYALQWSRHMGLKGNPEAPVVAICHYPEGITLELFSCDGGDSEYIKKASYLAEPTVDSHGLIDIPTKLYKAVVYYGAYLVSLAYGNVGVSNALLKEAYSFAEMTMPTAEQG